MTLVPQVPRTPGPWFPSSPAPREASLTQPSNPADLGGGGRKNKHKLGLFVLYNGCKKAEEYGSNGSDNLDEATADGTPSWWTLNFRYSVNISDKLIAQVTLENMLDVHYKTFSSGISAPGRNLLLSLKTEF